MEKFTWSESLNSGNEKLDDHNKELLALINKLYDRKRHLVPSSVLDDVIDYISYHFGEEEEYLRSIHYPDLDKHLKQHQDFIEEVLSMTETLFEGKLTIISIRILLKEWLLNHIKKEDTQVYRYQKDLKQLHKKYS